MLKVGFLLHFYQPSTQFPEVLQRITQRSYEPLLQVFEEFPESRFTLNIVGSLIDLWKDSGRTDILDRFRKIVNRKKVEIVGTGKYHPLLSKLSRPEIDHQILSQEKTLFDTLGIKKPDGFFPPELSYERPLAESLSQAGYKWILLDAKGDPELKNPDEILASSSTYKISKLPLKVAFRQAPLSYQIAFASIRTLKAFKNAISKIANSSGYLILAMDAETFGWHRQTQLNFLKLFLRGSQKRDTNFELVTLSQIFESFPVGKEIDPLASCWGNMELSDSGEQIFPRWDNPNNPVHRLQWQLLNLAIDSCANENEASEARRLLIMGEQSDQFWWASGNPCWLPPMVQAGAELLNKAIQASASSSAKKKSQGNLLLSEIIRVGLDKFGKKPVRC